MEDVTCSCEACRPGSGQIAVESHLGCRPAREFYPPADATPRGYLEGTFTLGPAWIVCTACGVDSYSPGPEPAAPIVHGKGCPEAQPRPSSMVVTEVDEESGTVTIGSAPLAIPRGI